MITRLSIRILKCMILEVSCYALVQPSNVHNGSNWGAEARGQEPCQVAQYLGGMQSPEPSLQLLSACLAGRWGRKQNTGLTVGVEGILTPGSNSCLSPSLLSFPSFTPAFVLLLFFFFTFFF